MKFCVRNSITDIYLTHNKEKPVVPELFIRTLNNKIYKHMTAISKKCILIN